MTYFLDTITPPNLGRPARLVRPADVNAEDTLCPADSGRVSGSGPRAERVRTEPVCILAVS